MSSVTGPMFDVRRGEARPALRAFLLLALVIAGHTQLETARDALFLGKLPPSRLALVYVLIAGMALVVAGPNARLVRRFGEGRVLFTTLAGAALGSVLLYLQSPTRTVVFLIYVWSAFLGTIMVVQIWMFLAHVFTPSQGKRLFGPIAAGGVTGAIAGASGAVAALTVVPVRALLLGAAGAFVLAALLSISFEVAEREPESGRALPPPSSRGPVPGVLALAREYPYIRWLAALTALSTAAVLGTDYLFKAEAARRLPAAELGAYFARSYAVFNVAAFVVQVLLAGPLVRRAGVVRALAVMPSLLLLGSAGVLVAGVPSAVLVTKGVDGSLRHSLHRLTLELLGLPFVSRVRARIKPILEGALPRAVQATMAGVIFFLATIRHGSLRELAALVAALTLAWLLVAIAIRGPHLDMWRRALSTGGLDADLIPDLDARIVSAMVQDLASRDPARVIAAMDVLVENRHETAIPGSVLQHESEAVRTRALDVMARTKRAEWTPLAERLLREGSPEEMRIAAVRALAACEALGALEACLLDESPAVRAHAAVALARSSPDREAVIAPRIREILASTGEPGRAGRLALLDAIRDTGDRRFVDVLLAITQPGDAEVMERAVLAMASVRDPRFIPALVRRLHVRSGRMSVRDALVDLGEPAQAALERALRDEATEPAIRLHIPRTLSRFGNQRAADFLTEQLATDPSRLVRYKVLRGLGRLVASTAVDVNGAAIWIEMHKNLVEHLGLLARWVPLDVHPETRERECGKLLIGLLDDKLRQSLERAFRLLQIIYRQEDIHGVYSKLHTSDRRGRSNALEFLDALTSGVGSEHERETRDLLKLAVDDLPPQEKVRRAAAHVPDAPGAREIALGILVRDRDAWLAALAVHHALELDLPDLRAEAESALHDRPSLVEIAPQLEPEPEALLDP